MKKKSLLFIFILSPLFGFSQSTCDKLLRLLIDDCDITLNEALSGSLDKNTKDRFVNRLKSLETEKCFYTSDKNITNAIIELTSKFQIKPPSPNPAMLRSYEGKLSVYSNMVLIYRQYLQTLLLENTINIYQEKIDTFLKNDSIYKDSALAHRKFIYDSLPEILRIIRQEAPKVIVNNTSTEIINGDTRINTLTYDQLLEILNTQTKTIIDSTQKIFNTNYKGAGKLPEKKSFDTISENIIGISGHEHSLYGIFYYRKFKSKSSTSWIIGPEIIIPVEAPSSSDPGYFLTTGLLQRKILLQIGVGWLKGITNNDVSWKCGIVYFPLKFGIGLSYSPITGFGTSVNYRFK